MRRLLGLLMLMGILTLVACGGSESNDEDTTNPTTDTSTQNDPPTSTDNAGFTATITGATEATVSGEGYLNCMNTREGDIFNLSKTFGGGVYDVIIGFPGGTEAGTYELAEGITAVESSPDAASSVEPFYARYIGEGEDLTDRTHRYENNVTGTLTLEEIALAMGEPVRGSFEFAASNSEGETVNVIGEFDFIAGSTYVNTCNESG